MFNVRNCFLTMATRTCRLVLRLNPRHIWVGKCLQSQRHSTSAARTNVEGSPSEPLLSQALRSELKNTTWNQLEFFRSLNQHYSSLLREDDYDTSDDQGNSRSFWEHIITEYEVQCILRSNESDKITRRMSLCSDLDQNHMIQLSDDGTSQSLPASLEVEFVWRVHLVNPQSYIADCMNQFGKVIPHNCNDPYPQFERQVITTKSAKQQGVWDGYGLHWMMPSAIKRQCQFVDKIMSVENITSDAIDGAIDRYEKFLHLMWAPDKPKGLIMVPTNDIDLIWHSHQLNPNGYQSFCIENSPTGGLVNHDDNIDTSVSFWKKTFGWTTESFWNSKYGEGTYRNGQQFVVKRTRNSNEEDGSSCGMAAWMVNGLGYE